MASLSDDDNWRHIADPKTRKRIQNRLSQRKVRDRGKSSATALTTSRRRSESIEAKKARQEIEENLTQDHHHRRQSNPASTSTANQDDGLATFDTVLDSIIQQSLQDPGALLMDRALTHPFEQSEDETAPLPAERADRFPSDGISYSAPWPSFVQNPMDGSQANRTLNDIELPRPFEGNDQSPGTGASTYNRFLSGTVSPSSSSSLYATHQNPHGTCVTQPGGIPTDSLSDPTMEWDEVFSSESATIQQGSFLPFPLSNSTEADPEFSRNQVEQPAPTTTCSTNPLQPAHGSAHQNQAQLSKEIVVATIKTILEKYKLKPSDLLERETDLPESSDSSRTNLSSQSNGTLQSARQRDMSSKATKEQVLQLPAECNEADLEKIVILYLKRNDR